MKKEVMCGQADLELVCGSPQVVSGSVSKPYASP